MWEFEKWVCAWAYTGAHTHFSLFPYISDIQE